MRSRNCTMGPDQEHIQPTKGFIKQQQEEEEQENTPELMKRKMKDGRTGVLKKPQRSAESGKTTTLDLNKKDLLHLLGIMEGEVQAREDMIGLLKSDRTRPEALEAHYGSADPTRPLQALQRDGLLSHGHHGTEDVYEKPMAELDRLEDKQKETYRRMLEQLLLAEKCHRRTVADLDNEKRKHVDFMNKSDDFTNLLEQERERLKRLLEQEKAYQARKDKDHSRRLEKVRAELVKLKSFALMLVDERQLHIEQIDQQSQKTQDLTQKLQEKEQRLATVTDGANEEGQKVLKLEAELEHRAAKFTQEHEEMTTKLGNQESQSRQLRLKLAGLAHKIEELEERNKVLQKSEEDLQELREKISKGECGNSSLMAELETLRKRVLEMEGKDEEITKTESQCRELRKRLQQEENHSAELRLDVDKLQKRMVELEKLEGAFNKSKTECSQLHTNLEREKRVVKDLAAELETVKTRLKELEASESKFEKTEMLLKDDLMKLKSFTVIMVDERKNMAERLRQEEQKSDDLSKMFKAEQGKVTEVTEKLIDESKKLLKFKTEVEVKVTHLAKEKDELKTKLASEEEKCRELNNKLSGMKIRMDRLEETESEMQRKWANKDNNKSPDEDNKVKELTLEIERLKSRLKQLEVVEGDLMKTEDEYDLLEKKFRTEQDKANTLSKLLEEMKSQIARNKAIEKGEVVSPEAELRTRCKMEEARTRELQAHVQALKEKIHELMNKEDQLSQLQVDYSVLQRRFMEEEEKKKSMFQEVDCLTKELESTKCYSRALRPGMNGRRMVDVPVTSTAVQTDLVASDPAEDETTAGFIRKSVLEENHLMSNLRQRGLKKPTVLERYPPASAELGARKSWVPWMKKKEAVTLNQTSPARTNGSSSLLSPEITMSPKPGQPLHIRVTPNHDNSTATLEITSPRAEDFFSSTTIIPTLGLQKPRITIVPKPTTVTSRSKACDVMGHLDRAKSPVTITTISRAKSPEKSNGSSSGRLQSPVSILTVSTTPVAEACASPEPHEMTAGRTVIKMTPETQPGPPHVRKYNANSNIITTEDNKIHIHLGPQFKRPSEGSSSPVLTLRHQALSSDSKETSTGTVLRSPRQTSTGKTSKMTSSITITPVHSAASRPTQSVPGSEVQSARSAATRIPVSKGVKPTSKALLGVSTVTRLESRAEGQSMKIELRKSTVCGGSAAGGKS
ncbi:filamin-A-interacting protein 1 [Hippoglossus hippoglossus]|uniref:filamin-A-interacting protein 1 n=1 Tax=Hippoglossus hippoglossus TaxID=8267 RepID=UPI00148B7D3D|nr:filamin-A-interacting protein 1 [Hippoglossus hippoglossus]XP_034436482.1 filamin-A-interacting protein 1 [Hippoglossus hippoglossus]XP_034436483.1 filamin-A-interacting protein 1 [Hippoglossus hippoglossus]